MKRTALAMYTIHIWTDGGLDIILPIGIDGQWDFAYNGPSYQTFSLSSHLNGDKETADKVREFHDQRQASSIVVKKGDGAVVFEIRAILDRVDYYGDLTGAVNRVDMSFHCIESIRRPAF